MSQPSGHFHRPLSGQNHRPATALVVGLQHLLISVTANRTLQRAVDSGLSVVLLLRAEIDHGAEKDAQRPFQVFYRDALIDAVDAFRLRVV